MIAAISGRALAAAARRAGYRPLVADFFGDVDTMAMADRVARLPGDLRNGIDGEGLLATLSDLAGDERPLAVVLGSGFEARTELVEKVAARFPLAGNRAEAIRRIKDPYLLSADCSDLGIPHPEVRREPPPDPQNWIVKTVGGAGGGHIRRANGESLAPGRYFQRVVAGGSVSALFIGDGETATIIGFSRQWTSRSPAAPYRYGGAVRLRRFSQADATMIGGWVSRLTRRAGLVGLCSADLVRASDGYRLIEINPRPGATLDIFDSDEAPLMEAHLSAARGEAYSLPFFAHSMASMITYTSRPIPRFPAIAWPEWTADRQLPGTELIAGDPVCTVLAGGANAAMARKLVNARARQLQHFWEQGRT